MENEANKQESYYSYHVVTKNGKVFAGRMSAGGESEVKEHIKRIYTNIRDFEINVTDRKI